MVTMKQVASLGMILCPICRNWYQKGNEASHRLNITHIMRKSRI